MSYCGYYPIHGYGVYLDTDETRDFLKGLGEESGEPLDVFDAEGHCDGRALDGGIQGNYARVRPLGAKSRVRENEWPSGFFLFSERQGAPFIADETRHYIEESYYDADDMALDFAYLKDYLGDGFDPVEHLASMEGIIS